MKFAAFLVPLAGFLAGCGQNQSDSKPQNGSAQDKIAVVTTLYPMQYLAERVGGNLVDAKCPVPVDEDPIFWMPDETAILQYQSADLIVLNGAHFAKWVEKVSLPQSKIVNSALPLKSEFIRYKSAVEHSHGKTGEHSHEGIDGHTWLDPVNCKVQAAEIRNGLVLQRPSEADAIEANFKALASDLDELDKGFKEAGLDASIPLLCSHPAYNYLARRYGWNIHNLDLDPGEMPSDETFVEIAEVLKSHSAKHILWESDPLPEIANRFASELSVRSTTISPCEARGDVDYLATMKENIEKLRSISEK